MISLRGEGAETAAEEVLLEVVDSDVFAGVSSLHRHVASAAPHSGVVHLNQNHIPTSLTLVDTKW